MTHTVYVSFSGRDSAEVYEQYGHCPFTLINRGNSPQDRKFATNVMTHLDNSGYVVELGGNLNSFVFSKDEYFYA